MKLKQILKEAFYYRLESNEAKNLLYRAFQNLESVHNNVKAGNDFNGRIVNNVIEDLRKVIELQTEYKK